MTTRVQAEACAANCGSNIIEEHDCFGGWCGCIGDIRAWQCGCYGHKDCYKDGLTCAKHGVHPWAEVPNEPET